MLSYHSPKARNSIVECAKSKEKVLIDNSRCASVCTKATSSFKNSCTPEFDQLATPVATINTKELIPESESSIIEDPAPLIVSHINSKAILNSIKISRSPFANAPKTKKIALHFKHLLNKSGKKSKNLGNFKEKIQELREQVEELMIRASVCETELRVKEKENSELKTMVSSLKELVSSELGAPDKTNDSVCKACALF
jgi:hypothetical protein